MVAAERTTRARDLAVGGVGLVVGLVGLGIGLGLFVPYATKVGLDAVTVGGALVTAVALVAVWWAGRRVLRVVPGWWRLLAIPATAVLLYVITSPIAIATAATHVPPTALAAETPADRGMPFVDATFTAADGTVLSGWFVPGQDRAAVVLRHGAGSTRSAVLDQAEVLHRHGYSVLMTDARGHGRSGGRAMDFGWHGDDDITAAVSWLAARDDVDPDRIGVVGLSMGGEEAIGAAAADPRIRVVVAEGATGRTAADHGWLSEAYGARGWLQERVDAVLYGVTELLSDAEPPISLRDAVTALDGRKALLIAAGDVGDEAEAGRWIAAGEPDAVTVWVVPGADHTGGLHTAPEEWERRVSEVLDGTIGAG